MMEQNVQTFITWTPGVQPTWLQYHGPSLHDRALGVQAERPIRVPAPPPPPPQFVLPPPSPPPPPPPEIFHSQFVPAIRTSPTSSPGVNPARLLHPLTAQDNQRTALTNSAQTIFSTARTQKRARTLKGAVSSAADHYSRRPFTVFTPKRSTRATRSRTTRCKHYCHAFLHHGRKCLSPCARRQPGHFHCRCARHQRQ